MGSNKPMMGRQKSGKKPFLDVNLILQQAIAHHDAGRHSEAAAVSRELLAAQPDNAIALDLVGVDLYLRGELKLANITLKRSIRNNGAIPDIHNHLGLVLEAQGQLDKAVASFHKSIALKPDYAEAHINLGNVLNKLDRPVEAIASYQNVIAINPRNVLGYFNLGVVLERSGRLEEAIGSYRRTLALDPDNAEALFNLGSCLQKLGQKEQLEQAIESFSRTLALKPDHFKAQLNLGAAQFSLHRLEDALASFRKAIDLNPDDAIAHYNLGSVYLQLNRLNEAKTCFERTITINPEYVGGHSNLGMTLYLMGEWDRASFHYRQSLRIDPDNVEANANLGSFYRVKGKFEAAIYHLERAINVQPDRAEAHWNLSLPLLATGNLEQGWQKYEWRWKGNERWIPTAPKKRNFPQPWWDGSDPKDRTILVWAEQGIGDEILFANVLPDIIAIAKHCVVECAPRLTSLFARSFPEAEVVARSIPPDPRTLMPDIDLQIPMGSLPGWFRTALGSFPAHPGYFTPDPQRVTYWAERLAVVDGRPKVGICWRSMDRDAERDLSYTELTQWGSIFSVPGVSFVNLQYDDCRAELEAARQQFGVEIHDWDEIDLMNDLDEVAALTAALDVVISPATSVAAMAGAIGTRVLQFVLDDNWPSLGTDRMPWFPNTKLFVRHWDESEPWGKVLEAIASDIKGIAADISQDRQDSGLSVWRKTKHHESKRALPNLNKRDIPGKIEAAIGHHKAGRLLKAEALYRQVLEIAPKHSDALSLLGRLTMERGDPVGAVEFISKAISINPDPVYFFNMALVKRALNLFDEAIACYRTALSIKPDFVEAHINLGNELKNQGKIDEAIVCYQKALMVKPDFAEAHCNLGDAYKLQGNLELAFTCYKKALALKPDYSEAHNGLGVVLSDQADFDAAIDHYLRALAIKEDNPAALCNLGLAYRTKGDISKSLEIFERAVSLQPDRAEYHWNLALSLLLSGNLSRGWQEYDWRWNQEQVWQFPPPAKRNFPQPWWGGENPKGKSILIWAEQGVGDAIMFANALPDIIAAAKHCVVECDPRLVPLFVRSFPRAEIVARETPPDPRTLMQDIDLQIPMGSLSRWFRANIESFPDHHGYLIPDPQRVVYWKRRLEAIDDRPKVGICWRSILRNVLRDLHYTELTQWGSIFSVPGVSFVNLQYDDCRAELEAARQQFGVEIHDWDEIDLMNDLDEVAALTAALDVVISPATSVAAMAGAIGTPVLQFVLVDNWPSLGTDRMPWFPSTQLSMRKLGKSWCGVLAAIAGQLAELSSSEAFRDSRRLVATQAVGSELNDTVSRAIQVASKFQQAGQFSEAEALYSQILEVQPNNPQVLSLLGVMAHQMGDSQLAIELLGIAIGIDPSVPSFHNNLGSVFEAMGRVEDAMASYVKASNIRPDYADAHYNLGTVQYRLGRKEEAIASFNKAITADPESFKAHNNLGVVLAELSDFDGVIRHYLRALEIQPNHIAALSNLASAYRMRGEVAKSIEFHQRVLSLEPDRAETHWNLSLSLLMSGNLVQGWQEYEWRWKGDAQWVPPPPTNRNFPQPWWSGEDINDKTILIWTEQGVGDEILFANVLPDIISAAKHCVVECDPRLISLFARSFPTAEIVARTTPSDPRTLMPDIDLQIPIGNLPRWFRPNLESFPKRQGYLIPDPRRVAYWKQKLDALDVQLKVGICWRSMYRNAERDLHYSTLGQWGDIFSVPGATFVNLQYDDCSAELAEVLQLLGVEIHVSDDIDLLNDLDESAALTAALDLVIAPSTSVAAMAGALGKPVLQFTASDNWPALGSNRMPWFPNTKLFIRNWGDSWEKVFHSLANNLRGVVRRT